MNEIKGLHIHGITDTSRIDDRVPTISFTHATVSPTEVAKTLTQANICVWSGHNYAFEVVKQLGLDEEQGVLRIGIAQYNTETEIDRTLEVLTGLLGQSKNPKSPDYKGVECIA